MIRRLLSSILVVWALGFLWFALALPQPAGPVSATTSPGARAKLASRSNGRVVPGCRMVSFSTRSLPSGQG